MSAREERIDILRGMAIFIIVINHLTWALVFYGLKGRGIPTPTTLGYSSSAELFVIMSGYMVGLVYLSKRDAERAVLRRARTLYLYNAVLLVAILPLLYVMSESEAHYWRLDRLLHHPWNATLKFIGLLYGPNLLDVLQMYMILMLATPLAIFIYRRSPLALIALSVAAYAAVQIARVSGVVPALPIDCTFNPFAWQILFFLPMMLGAKSAHRPFFRIFEGRPLLLLGLFGLMLIGTLLKFSHAEHALPRFELFTSKPHLGVVRLAHAVLMVWLYGGLLVLTRPMQDRQPFQILAKVGRNSLNCFALNVLTTYSLALLWDRCDAGYVGYLACVAFSLFVTCCAADILDARSRSTGSRRPEHADLDATAWTPLAAKLG